MEAIILTRSGKFGGACVAGIDVETKQFVRFVSEANTAKEIPFSDIRGLNELDIVEVQTIRPCPIGPQTENVLVPRFAFRKTGTYGETISALYPLIRYPDCNSLLNHTNNRLNCVDNVKHSLELILVHDLLLQKYVKPYNNSATTRASFSYQGKFFSDFRVTAPQCDLRKSKETEYAIPLAGIVLSIPKESFVMNGIDMGYYKFLAAIFPIEEETPDIRNTKQLSTGRQHLRDTVPGARNNSYEPWTKAEDEALINEFLANLSVQKMAERHQRSNGAIRARLKKLGYVE